MQNIIPSDDQFSNSQENLVMHRRTLWRIVFGLVIFFTFFYSLLLSAPIDFPVGTIFKIEHGSNLRNVSLKLKNEHIIRSRLAFEFFVILFDREKHIISSDYFFENKLPVFEIARRISKGEHHLAPVVITIPEGFDVAKIADAFSAKLPNFDKNKFLLDAKELEGYLFPDTYFFLTTDTETEVIKSMSDNFEKKIAVIRPEIVSSGKITGRTERQIIVMASIIEGEANGEGDRAIISGILWRRISISMPLQVDVAPETYKTKGLPKNPISNPGMAAIKSAIYPQSSSYLYYLHDKEGNIHYARTFSEHIKNKFKYLR